MEDMMLQPRLSIPLNSNWSFKADPANEGLLQKWHEHGFQDGETVQVPHTWNVQDGLEEFRGTGWYAYSFDTEPAWQGKLARLQFEAVYRDAVVWVNGRKAGEHAGSGYTAFVVDITKLLRPGGTNLLVVSVNNENSKLALPCGNSFDWADDGGIIRDVTLLITGQCAIDYAKLSAQPVFAEDGGGAAHGLLTGTVKLWGAAESACGLEVGVAVKYGDMLLASEECCVQTEEQILVLPALRVERPHLWHFDHPHLYEVRLQLKAEGQVSDELIVHMGFREIVTEGSKLLLNREPVRLMGVEWMPGSHPERGMAETEQQLAERLRQIKHANCVITRFHWQQGSKLLDWCDRNGLLVQEEIPHWQQPAEPDDTWLPLARQHAEEMINRHYNHACVYAWGIGNEVNGQHPGTVSYMHTLKEYVQTLDASRMVNYVSNTVHVNPAGDATGAGDMIFWNDYIGTWHGDLDRSEVIGQLIGDYPDKPIVVAEYGLCEPAFAGGDPRRMEILLQNTLEYRKHPGIAALIYFSLNDYRTQMGEEGEGRLCQRVHGSTDLYGNPKPSYKMLRSIGSPVMLSAAAGSAGGLVLTIEARNDVPSHRIAGYSVELWGANLQPMRLEVPALAPGERCALAVGGAWARDSDERDWSAGHVRIMRPNQFSVLEGRLAEFMAPLDNEPLQGKL
jgi:beta-galactosidase